MAGRMMTRGMTSGMMRGTTFGMTEAIIFDFGSVLAVPADWAAWEAHRDAMAGALGFASGAAMWSHIFEGPAWGLAKTGRLTDEAFWRQMLAPYGLDTLAARRAWVEHLGGPLGEVHPRMRELLARLKGRYKLALLSNATDDLARALRETHRLDGVFDVTVISALVGVAKPDAEIYRITLERLGLPAAQTLFIDDQARNTQAAEALGIPSIVFPGVEALWTALIG